MILLGLSWISAGIKFWTDISGKNNWLVDPIIMTVESLGMYLILFDVMAQDDEDDPVMGMLVRGLLQYCLVRSIIWYVFTKMNQQTCREQSEQTADKTADVESLTPASVYTDLDGPGSLYKSCLTFCLQVVLYSTLCVGFLKMKEPFKLDPCDDDPNQCGAAAIQLQILVKALNFQNKKKAFFLLGSVVGVFMRPLMETFYSTEDESIWKHFHGKTRRDKDRGWEIFLRWLMSFVVNEIYPLAVIFMVPLVLCQAEENVEFVKDATAILFIHQLDNITGEPMKIEKPKEKEKDNLKQEKAAVVSKTPKMLPAPKMTRRKSAREEV